MLSASKANVNVYDPVIMSLPGELSIIINLFSTAEEALCNADLIVVSTEWPQFSNINFEEIIHSGKAMVIDANGFLKNTFENDTQVSYYRIGKVYEIKK